MFLGGCITCVIPITVTFGKLTTKGRSLFLICPNHSSSILILPFGQFIAWKATWWPKRLKRSSPLRVSCDECCKRKRTLQEQLRNTYGYYGLCWFIVAALDPIKLVHGPPTRVRTLVMWVSFWGKYIRLLEEDIIQHHHITDRFSLTSISLQEDKSIV